VLELLTTGHKREELIWFEEPDMDRQWIHNCNRHTEDYSDGVMEWSTPLSLELALQFNGKLPSFIENWGDLHLDMNQQWISEAAQEKHIMAEDLGRKGRTIRGLGSFPRMQKSTCSRAFCSGTSMDQWTEMQTQFSQIVGSVSALQKDNEKLRAELEAIKGSLMGKAGESSQQQHQIRCPSKDDAYDHLSATNSDEYRA
ncbi:unnamed protein product, partial [Prunus brigantina]